MNPTRALRAAAAAATTKTTTTTTTQSYIPLIKFKGHHLHPSTRTSPHSPNPQIPKSHATLTTFTPHSTPLKIHHHLLLNSLPSTPPRLPLPHPPRLLRRLPPEITTTRPPGRTLEIRYRTAENHWPEDCLRGCGCEVGGCTRGGGGA